MERIIFYLSHVDTCTCDDVARSRVIKTGRLLFSTQSAKAGDNLWVKNELILTVPINAK